MLVPDNVSVPVPTLTREPSVPEITPLTSVDKLLPPTVSSLAPNRYEPAPAIEPALSLLSPAGPVLAEKSTTPPPLLVMAALPAVLLLLKFRLLLLVMVALPAVLVLLKFRFELLVMVALPAVLVLLKFSEPVLLMVALPAVLDWKKRYGRRIGDAGAAGRAVG